MYIYIYTYMYINIDIYDISPVLYGLCMDLRPLTHACD